MNPIKENTCSKPDPDRKLREAYPCTYEFCKTQGYFRIPEASLLTRSIEGGMMLGSARNTAVLRLDMAIAYLWPHLKDYFNIDIFKSRLETAVDLLKALEYEEEEELPPHVPTLGKELKDALLALEAFLKKHNPEAEKAAKSAERPQE